MCSCNLLKKLCLQSDVIPKASKAFVGVSTHLEHEQTLRVDLLDAIRAPQAELKDAATLVGKLRNPFGHPRESDCAAGLNHGERANAKVSDGSQPEVTLDLSLSETAGSRSLDRRVR